MAPSWMITVKASHPAPTPRARSATSRWAVEDTGMNSVRPSTIPRRIETIMSCMAIRYARVGQDLTSHLLRRHHRANKFWYGSAHEMGQNHVGLAAAGGADPLRSAGG